MTNANDLGFAIRAEADVQDAADEVRGALGDVQDSAEQTNQALGEIGQTSKEAGDALGDTAGAADTAREAWQTFDSAGLTPVTESAASASSGLGDLAGIVGSLSGEMGGAVGNAGNLGTAIAEMVGAEGGVGLAGILGVAAAGAAGLAALGTAGAGVANDLVRLTAVTGMSADEVQFWGNAFADAGLSANSLVSASRLLGSGINSLNDSITASHPLTEKESDLLKAMGGSVRDADGNVRSFADAFPIIVQNLSQMTNATEQARVGQEIFGRSWGTLAPLITNYSDISAKATEQTERSKISMDEARELALTYNASVQDLRITFEELAITVLPAFSSALQTSEGFFEGFQRTAEDVDDGLGLFGVHLDDIGGAILRQVPAYNAAGVVSDLFSDRTIHVAEAADRAAASQGGFGGAMASVTPLMAEESAVADALSGSLGRVDAALRGAQAAADARLDTTIRSIRMQEENKIVTDAAFESISKETDAISVQITANKAAEEQAKADAAAKTVAASAASANAAAQAEAAKAAAAYAQTLPGMVDQEYKSAAATELHRQALAQYNAEQGIATDLQGRAIPTMRELVNRHLDSIDAERRDTIALREASRERGIQLDLNGRVIKTFREMVNEQKASILASQQMAKATAAANKELGIQTKEATATAGALTKVAVAAGQAFMQESKYNTTKGGYDPAYPGGGKGPLAPGTTIPLSQFSGSAPNPTPGSTAGNTGMSSGPIFIPHEMGLDYVPYDNYPALLHKGEKVKRAGSSDGLTVNIIVLGSMIAGEKEVERIIRDAELRGAFRGTRTNAA